MFYMPVRFLYGKNSIKTFDEKLNYKKALIVTGKSSAKKSGALADVIELLEKNKISYLIYDKITENPTLESVTEGSELFSQNACDLFIGIGGGSPIDAAKAMSVIAANNLKNNEIYNAELIKKAFDIISVPTTSGTGTEVTPFSVITTKTKKAGFGNPLIFPKISFLDAQYTISMPASTTLNTAIDALSHLLEGIYSSKRQSYLNPLIFEGIKLIYQNLKPCLNNLTNYEHRDALLTASMYGGMVIAQTSTTLQHSIGYPLTYCYNTAHGLVNGLVMKEIMKLFKPHVTKTLEELFAYLGITEQEFFAWLDSLELKANFTLTNEWIENNVNQVLASRNMALNPFKVSKQQIVDIYKIFK